MKQELDQPEITKRIQILIEDAMCSEAMYAKKAGIDPGNFHKKLVGIQKWTINDIKKICTKFNVSKEWIVDGKGDMMTKDDYQPQMKTLPSDLAQTISIGTEKTKLRIPTKALAGYLSDYVDGVRVEDCEPQPVIHQFPPYDFTMIIKGNSMEPKFEGGDEIACKRVYDFIEWGKTYVLDTTDGAVVKRIYDAGDKIRCVSYNKDEYPDFFIEKENVRRFFKIVGLIRV